MTQFNPEPAANPYPPAPRMGDAGAYPPPPPPQEWSPGGPPPPVVPEPAGWSGQPPPAAAPPPDQASWVGQPPHTAAPPPDQAGWSGPPPRVTPADKPAAKGRPGLVLSVIGLVLMVLSPAPAVALLAVTAVQVVDAVDHSTAIPASEQWIGTSNMMEGTYYIWSTTGELPGSCEVMKGDPADDNPIKLSAVESSITLPGESSLKPVKQFQSTGSQVSLRCLDQDQAAAVTILYLMPATKASMVTNVILGVTASGLLFVVGLALLITQTMRRAAWNNRQLKAAGLI
ncbi:MAG: hypothetical protein FWG16_05465 [Micrococcales bacterium]|nr:hypothetical protein [Micrococcales bacterium]